MLQVPVDHEPRHFLLLSLLPFLLYFFFLPFNVVGVLQIGLTVPQMAMFVRELREPSPVFFRPPIRHTAKNAQLFGVPRVGKPNLTVLVAVCKEREPHIVGGLLSNPKKTPQRLWSTRQDLTGKEIGDGRG